MGKKKYYFLQMDCLEDLPLKKKKIGSKEK